MHTGTVAILALALASSHSSAGAGDPSKQGCTRTEPQPVPPHRPFVLTDPRSGLRLHLEADGRHMTAMSGGGKVVWHRNLFGDPRIEKVLGVPPPQFPGEPPFSEAKFRRQIHDYVGNLYISSIAVVSECEKYMINHRYRQYQYGPNLLGHYIRAGSGTRIYYLLDAGTGDFMIESIN